MQRHVAIALATSLAAACSGGDASTAADAADGVDASPADAGGDSAFDLHVFDPGQRTGLAGATVCVVGQSDCELTDAGGDATVSVAGTPTDLQVAFVASAAGHLSAVGLGRIYVQLDIFVHTVPTDLGLLADADASELFTAAGLAYPATSTGYVRATVLDGATTGAEEGATVTLDGSASAPVYLDDDGRPAPASTAIGPGGGVLFGDVPAGPFSLTVHVAHKVCSMQSYGWYSGSASADGVVVAGALTDGLTLACYDNGR